jgi:hypothetical protein
MPPSSPRPLAVTSAVALVSVGLLVLAVGRGWLGADVGRGDEFCETAGTGWVKQPANTWSNLGFVVAGLLVAWRAGRPDRIGQVLPRNPGVATAYACVVVLLGPGSAAMHATQSAAGGHLDVLSMYVLASFAVAYALMRWFGRDRWFLAQVFSLAVAACELVGSYDGAVPVVLHAGNLAFGALVLTAVLLEVALARRSGTRTDLRWGAAAVATILVAFAIWTVSRHGWCDPHSWVQGHAAWHLLGAVSAYLLFRLWASERAQANPRRASGSSSILLS